MRFDSLLVVLGATGTLASRHWVRRDGSNTTVTGTGDDTTTDTATVTDSGSSAPTTLTITTIPADSTATPTTDTTAPIPSATDNTIIIGDNGTGDNAQAPGVIAPTRRYLYDVGTGALTCNPPQGVVSKSTTNNGHDTTTLVVFTYPAASTGKKCRFSFSLGASDTLDGSRRIDVFGTTEVPTACTTGWPPGNKRDIQLGRMNLALGAAATWDWTSSSYLTSETDCKPAGTVEAFELVGVWDVDEVRWGFTNGARILYN